MVLSTLRTIKNHLDIARTNIEQLRSDSLMTDYIDAISPMLSTIQEHTNDALADSIKPWPKTANHAADRYEFIPTGVKAMWGRYEVLSFKEALKDWRQFVIDGVPFQMNVISDEAFLFDPVVKSESDAYAKSVLYNCNNYTAPDWTQFTGLELEGNRIIDGDVQNGFSKDRAEFFSIYARGKDHLASAVTDIWGGFDEAVSILKVLSDISGLPYGSKSIYL